MIEGVRLWLKSRRHALLLAGTLLGGVVLGIVFWGGFNTAMEQTNTLGFCISCHEMRDTVYVEYQQSVHFKNASGVRAICSDCHVPHDWVHKVVRKVQATNELYHKIIGTIDTPEKFEAHRLELARHVWATMEATDLRECRNCHSFEAMDFHKQREKAAEQMPKAMEAGETCISCHKGIAHKLPDMTQGYKATLAEMLEVSTAEAARSDTLYTLSTMPLFLDHAAVSPDATGDGKLLAASEVHVVERDGSWLKVEIPGWQQDGAERAIYALRGQRILTAALAPAAIEKVERLGTETDPDTDIVWHQAKLTAWIPDRAVSADKEKVWGYAAEMYNASCSNCHAARATTNYLANQWAGNLNAMKRFISLDDEQSRFLLKYLQFHAKDTIGAASGS